MKTAFIISAFATLALAAPLVERAPQGGSFAGALPGVGAAEGSAGLVTGLNGAFQSKEGSGYAHLGFDGARGAVVGPGGQSGSFNLVPRAPQGGAFAGALPGVGAAEGSAGLVTGLNGAFQSKEGSGYAHVGFDGARGAVVGPGGQSGSFNLVPRAPQGGAFAGALPPFGAAEGSASLAGGLNGAVQSTVGSGYAHLGLDGARGAVVGPGGQSGSFNLVPRAPQSGSFSGSLGPLGSASGSASPAGVLGEFNSPLGSGNAAASLKGVVGGVSSPFAGAAGGYASSSGAAGAAAHGPGGKPSGSVNGAI